MADSTKKDQSTLGDDSFRSLDTKHFADAEKSAKEIAQNVEELRNNLETITRETTEGWMGAGYKQFDLLAETVKIQMKDVSQEFWDLYDSLVNAEASFLEADDELRTKMNSSSDS